MTSPSCDRGGTRIHGMGCGPGKRPPAGQARRPAAAGKTPKNRKDKGVYRAATHPPPVRRQTSEERYERHGSCIPWFGGHALRACRLCATDVGWHAEGRGHQRVWIGFEGAEDPPGAEAGSGVLPTDIGFSI